MEISVKTDKLTAFEESLARKTAVTWGAAACLAIMLPALWASTRIEFVPGVGFHFVPALAVSGDEPHYLIAINSILFDHDLQVQDDYRRVQRGGLEAGLRFRGWPLDHHSILVNRRTGHHAGSLGLHSMPAEYAASPAEFAPSPDVYEVPAHPVLFPLLVAALIAPFRPSVEQVERFTGLVIVIFSWLGAVGTFVLARRVGLSEGLALLSVLLLVLASPWLTYTRAFYPEPVVGLALVAGLWALQADRPALAAIAAAVAAMLKPPFAVVGAGFVLAMVLERRWRDAALMSLLLGAFGLATCLYNYWLAGTAVISGNNWMKAHDFQQLYETLLGPEQGLLIFVPWAIFALADATAFILYSPPVYAIRFRSADSSLIYRIALSGGLYLALLTLTGWGPGFSYGPRYWVPFLPWLAVATVDVMRRAGGGVRATCALLVLLSVAIAVPAALRYPSGHTLLQPPASAWRGFY